MNFEKKFNELGSRFFEYLQYKGLKGKDVAEITGYSGSQISNIVKGKVFGSDKLFNILNIFNDLDSNWLLTGKGQMLRKNKPDVLNNDKSAFNDDLKRYEIELLKKDLENARSSLEDKTVIIKTQQDLINNLKSEIENLKAKKK